MTSTDIFPGAVAEERGISNKRIVVITRAGKNYFQKSIECVEISAKITS
jgi:hypothetical protein